LNHAKILSLHIVLYHADVSLHIGYFYNNDAHKK